MLCYYGDKAPLNLFAELVTLYKFRCMWFSCSFKKASDDRKHVSFSRLPDGTRRPV